MSISDEELAELERHADVVSDATGDYSLVKVPAAQTVARDVVLRRDGTTLIHDAHGVALADLYTNEGSDSEWDQALVATLNALPRLVAEVRAGRAWTRLQDASVATPVIDVRFVPNCAAARADERAKVVAWLRDKGFGHHASNVWDSAADAIERGEHEEKKR